MQSYREAFKKGTHEYQIDTGVQIFILRSETLSPSACSQPGNMEREEEEDIALASITAAAVCQTLF